ncbi:MAG: hypothetical protein KatS3mg105_1552 [Gemmatales bacterium]|nr:MAG: hypothetical protein KatS3mg105_1552 [Gemmatales bacterium]
MPHEVPLTTVDQSRTTSVTVCRNQLVEKLLESSLILPEDWEKLPRETRDELWSKANEAELLHRLVHEGLLTEYQAGRIASGKMFGLVIGNYRVLDRLGAGGMGVVFKAEHIHMRRTVAIKVLPSHLEERQLLARFFTEMRMVARLQHPNIVAAIDGGTWHSNERDGQVLHYFVMEYVPGKDLERLVEENGPLSVAQSCDIIYQVASALAEAHKNGLVHRDLKPSNILVTADWQAKLLDFGMAQQMHRRLTEPGMMMGTADYMAPEQARDARSVDQRADIYGMGGTLYWCLTGHVPFESNPMLREFEQPPSPRSLQPGIPVGLESVIMRMLAPRREDRYPSCQAVMRALLCYLSQENRRNVASSSDLLGSTDTSIIHKTVKPRRTSRVLVVEDIDAVSSLCQRLLERANHVCDVVASADEAIKAVHSEPYDLVLIDVHLGDTNCLDILPDLRDKSQTPNLKIILMSGRASADDMAEAMHAGADDFMAKPFGAKELIHRVQWHLNLKHSQDLSEEFKSHLLTVNAELEKGLNERESELFRAQNGIGLGLIKVIEHAQIETKSHLLRMQRYCRFLAEEACQFPAFGGTIDLEFIQFLEQSAPLHDIGMVSIPRHILMKSGELTTEERFVMQEHTVLGARILQDIVDACGQQGYLPMAIEIVKHHHEQFDGKGYPEGLSGNDIPLAARLVALADAYDSIRSCRPYKPALSHSAAIEVISDRFGTVFDPDLKPVFARCVDRWNAIYREIPD